MNIRMSLAAMAVAGLATGGVLLALDAGAQPKGKPEIGAWGFDLGAMDKSVKPGDDFFRHTGGTWMKNTKIPADRTRWGSFNILAAKSEEDVKNLVNEVSAKKQAPGSAEQKVADFYSSYLDTKKIDALGLAPFQADLDRISALKTHEETARLIGDPGMAANSPIAVGFFYGLDDKNPDRYAVDVLQAGLGMPDRDYYLKSDAKFAETRTAYKAYVAQMLGLAKYPNAAAAADAVMAVEMKIAEKQWPIEKQRDRDISFVPKSPAELKAFAPQFPWDEVFQAGGLTKQDRFILRTAEPVQLLAKLFRDTPVETWRAYLTFHYLNAQADILPTAFDDASFAFNGKVLTGQETKRDRWKRAVLALSGQFGGAPLAEAVGAVYVKRHFTPQAKAQVKELVDNLLLAYRNRIETLEWMSPETRKIAMRKAQTVRVKIGYPDRWRDYSKLEIKAGDAYGNRKRAAMWDWNRQASRLAQKADKDEWGMAPQTVNAYYNPTWNEIVFPAAILQAPFFDPNADAAVNYGAIGGVIGHEMGHGYDDQGAKSDENGILRTWWKKDDEDRFAVKVKALAAQYSSYEPLPGVKVNGDFTSGENIGDLGGVAVSFEAYRLSLKGKDAPVTDGFTGNQRFFLGWCQVWRSIIRDEALRVQVTSDVHSPAEYRCNGSVRNVDAWYDAFGVKPGDKMYLKPEDRVRIW
ncbi:MAG: M13 family metallopeptidase [Alphaproteobacteria bacterium]|nr:M13 family metallopeptidase [Alphaproteobacteria bacterium]